MRINDEITFLSHFKYKGYVINLHFQKKAPFYLD